MLMDEMDGYRERIRENIGCGLLLLERPYDAEEIVGYVELMAETCASRREYIRVNGEEVPTELVRKRFLKLDGEHIRYRHGPVPDWLRLAGDEGALVYGPAQNTPDG